MIRINLLPFRAARKKENIRRQISVFLLCFAFILIAAIYYNFYLGGKIDGLKESVAATKKELGEYTKINKQISQIKKKLNTLEKKTKVIVQLERNRFAPVKMLETMSTEVLAKRMWFTGFQDVGKMVKITGIALDNKTVADFMIRLENTGKFGSVKLNKVQRQVRKGSSLKKFTISCRKKAPPKAPQKNNKPKKKKK